MHGGDDLPGARPWDGTREGVCVEDGEATGVGAVLAVEASGVGKGKEARERRGYIWV